MAIYGADFYALSKYGTPATIDYGVEPFTAEPIGLNRIRLTWKNPTGTWTKLRLLQNRYGYAITADDGQILIETDPPSVGEYVSVDSTSSPILMPWRYYSLFVLIDSVWQRAGAVSTLALQDTDTTDRLLRLIPRYYRLANPSELTGNAENVDLPKFMASFGFGVDYLETYARTLPAANDPSAVHLGDLESLALQMGIEYVHAVPARLMRQRVINGALLAKQRGTWNGLRDVTALSAGFDTELTLGPNLMLNQDQSSFYYPLQYPEWDSARAYAGSLPYGSGDYGSGAYGYPGDRVHFAGNDFAAAVGAKGDDQKPSTDPVDNAYWTYIDRSHDGTLYNRYTSNISTWQALLWGPEAPLYCIPPIDATDPLSVYVSGTNDSHTGRNDSNILAIQNTSAGTRDMLARSISYADGEAVFDPENVVKSGVPIPRTDRAWAVDDNYARGDLVVFKGRVWRALKETLGASPPGDDDSDDVWEALGVDRRIRMCLSAYAHGPLTGTPGAGGLAVEPYVAFFSAQGKLLTAVSGVVTPNVVYDGFRRNSTVAWASRVTDFGSETWQVLSGSGWRLDSNSDVGFATPTSTGVSVVDAGVADCRVAVTMVTGQPYPSWLTGLVFRAQDANHYWRVTKFAVEDFDNTRTPKYVAHATFTTPFADGDRMMVDLSGSTITVYNNGVQVAQFTSALFQTATKHGMFG